MNATHLAVGRPMGFGEAFINVLLATQAFLHSPIVYDKGLDKLVANPNVGNRWKMWRWYFGNIFIFAVWVFSWVHLILLMKQYDPETSGKAFKEELLSYVFTVAITTQAVLTWETVGRDPPWFAYVEGQILKAYGVHNQGWPMGRRKPDIHETASYFLAAGFACFPLIAIVLPIIRSYDPINQMFLTFIPLLAKSPIRFPLVLVAYLLSVSFGALSCLNMVLLAASHCFIATRMTHRNLQISINYLNHCPSLRYDKKSQITHNITQITMTELRNLRNVFQKRRQFYVQLKLITTAIDINLSSYAPGMCGVGMAICIFSNYGVIEFHNRLPKVMIGGMAFISFFMMTLTLNLLMYASYPKTKSELFVRFWRRVNIGKIERKQVKAMVPVFLGMGHFFSIKPSTALDFMDAVVQWTINLLLG